VVPGNKFNEYEGHGGKEYRENTMDQGGENSCKDDSELGRRENQIFRTAPGTISYKIV